MIKKHQKGRRVTYSGRHPGLDIRWITERYQTQLNCLSYKTRMEEIRYLLAGIEDMEITDE